MSTIATSGRARVPDPTADVPPPQHAVLTAPLTNTFGYTRSLGPVLSQFALALRDGRIVGSKGSDGKVAVPPVEFDPTTGAHTTELVDVATVGTVTTWTWNPEPAGPQPLDVPFAWALIRLDGADTALLHAVRVDSPDELHTGLRVHARWRAARTGRIDDISHFAPGQSPTPAAPNDTADDSGTKVGADSNVVITTPITTTITHSATEEESWYLEGLKAGKLYGSRIGTGVDAGRVYFPPRKVSPSDGAPALERVELPDTGTVTTFCIVNVPFQGQRITPPYVAAYVLLDGTDIPFLHLILDCPADEVRMGMRVQAVWAPAAERELSLGSISHFRPTGEPDADFASYREFL
ncbi:OB-fold domain-containing protein [Gordonia sp. DT30]|uniref:OB-fold nucleic acid binding domain-containing protein n=1 Tax=Gordonia sp. DT30 TaxID=3416546 RepID=UPI003CE76F54